MTKPSAAPLERVEGSNIRGVLLLLIGIITGSVVFTAAGAHGNAGRTGPQAIVPGVTSNLSGATISREPMPAVTTGNQPIGAPTPRPHPTSKVIVHVPFGPWPQRLANDINRLPGWNTSTCSLPAGPGYYLYEISFQYESDRWTLEVDRSAHEHVFPRYAGGPQAAPVRAERRRLWSRSAPPACW